MLFDQLMRQISRIFVIFYSSYAFDLGARNAGLAGASVAVDDPWSLFNNIGALGRVKKHTAFASYQNRYGIPEFGVIGAGVVYATQTGVAGVGFFKSGDDLFSRQRIHIGIGHRLQWVSWGVGVDLVQYHVSSIGTKHVMSIQFGGVVDVTKHFRFGVHLLNLNQAEISKETSEKLPTVMKVGLSYQPNRELMANLEVEKDLSFDEVLKIGIEYRFIDRLFLRTGISTPPAVRSFGIGFKPRNYQIDYAYVHNSNLGAIHEIAVSLHFKSKG